MCLLLKLLRKGPVFAIEEGLYCMDTRFTSEMPIR